MNLILINGKIITMNNSNPTAQAVAVKDRKIVKVGNNDEVLVLKDGHTTVIDLKGKTVVPGFNDSHMHLLNYAYSLKKVDCSGARSVEEILERGKEYIKQNNGKR